MILQTDGITYHKKHNQGDGACLEEPSWCWVIVTDWERMKETEVVISHSALEMIWQIVTSLFSRVEWQAGVSVESADTNSCSQTVSHYLRSKIQRRKGLFVSIYQTRN